MLKVIPLILISVRMGYDSIDHRIHCIVKKSPVFFTSERETKCTIYKEAKICDYFSSSLLLLNT